MKKGIAIIDIINLAAEGEEANEVLKSNLYVNEEGSVTYVMEIEDTDLDLIMKRSKAELVSFMKDSSDENASVYLSDKLTSMVLATEFKSYKTKLTKELEDTKHSMLRSSNLLIGVTDEQMAFITAYEKAADYMIGKINE